MALIALTAGILVTWRLGPVEESVLLWLLLCSPAGIIYGLRRRKPGVLVTAVGALFLFLGCFLSGRDLVNGAQFDAPPDVLTVHASIVDKLGSGKGFRVFRLESGVTVRDGTALPGLGRLVLKECGVPLCSGDRIAFRSRVTRPTNRGNPGDFDWELYCRNSGIAWLVHVQREDSVVLISPGSRFRARALLYGLRERIGQFLDAHFPQGSTDDTAMPTRSDIGAIIKGVVLGDRAEISPALNKSFVDSGTVHILAASGLHVGIVAFATVAVVRLITWPFPLLYIWVPLKKLAAMASIPSIVGYCLLVGARSATVRATIMGLVVSVALISDRRWRSWNSLCIAALAILLVYPLSLYAVDFQLSFAAVAGILAVVSGATRVSARGSQSGSGSTGRLQRVRDWCGQWTYGVLLTSGGASLGVLPILLWVFHSIPVYSVPANLVAIPLFTLTLPLSLLGCLVGLWSPWGGGLILWPAEHCTRFAVRWQMLIAGLPGSTIQVPEVSVLLLSAVVGICLAVAFLLHRKVGTRRGVLLTTYGALVGSMLLIWLAGQASGWCRTNLRVTFLNVGKADAAMVEFPNGARMLVDAGRRIEDYDAGVRYVLPALRWSAIGSLDWVMASHPDMDHTGGLLSVIREIPTKAILWNPVPLRSGGLAEAIAELTSRGGQVLRADKDAPVLDVGRAKMRFLNDPGPEVLSGRGLGTTNNSSVVCRIEFGEVSFLFVGDLEHLGEQSLLATGRPLGATVLKVGHHGCKSSTSEAFVRAVSPRVALISSDAEPWSKCPDPRVIDRLKSEGTRIFWTGRDGAVTMETDGNTLWIRTGKKPGSKVEVIASRSRLLQPE